MNMLDRKEASKLMVDYLRKAMSAHLAGRFEEIEIGYEEMDSGMPRDGGIEWDNLFVALAFWDGWIDSRDHGWLYYEPLTVDDWPVLADAIAGDIESGRDITELTVLDMFFFRRDNG